MQHDKRWLVQPNIPAEAEQVLCNYSPVLRRILYNRGYATPEAANLYLEALVNPEHHPLNIKGMVQAVERIESAIRRQEPIAVYGDYDCDGVTATALLVLALKSVNANVREYIPNRFDEGYGLNTAALDYLKEQGIQLVITVDCGVRSVDEAEHARRIGLDLIITDHHHPGYEVPQCVALINPKQPGDTYPEKNLAGVGLAYKLASALFADLQSKGYDLPAELSADDYLDLVAIGTVADMAPLTGENRFLVRQGLQRLRKCRRQGLFSLINAAGLVLEKINAENIGFVIGPRLNAAGRLESALAAYDLLTTLDLGSAARLVQQLDDQNRDRQDLTRKIQAQAEQITLNTRPAAKLLFAAHADFNPGVVGLAASRLVEQYYRPAIVAHLDGEFVRASCRSIPEFHITEALDRCSDILVHHGGHAAAAGFTVRHEHLQQLIERLEAIAQEQLANMDLRPTLSADLEINLRDLRPEILNEIELLQPCGYGNPQVVFVSRNLRILWPKVVGKDGAHLKFSVEQDRIRVDAIAFRKGHLAPNLPPMVDLMYTFELNEYNGRTSLQLKVKDLKPAGAPD